MRRATLCILLLFVAVLTARAKDSGLEDRVRFGRPLIVEANETIGDAVCIGCPIINRGRITGDAVVLMGPLNNDTYIAGDAVVVMGPLHNIGEVGGDAVVVMGPLNVGANGTVGHDATVVMGSANIASGAVVHGKVEHAMPAGGVLGVLFFLPLTIGLVLAIVLALICYSIAGHRRIVTVAESVRRKPGLSLVTGIGTIVVFVFALWVFAHMHPISGLLVVAACILLVLTMIVGYTGLSFAIGSRLRSSSPVATIVVGAIVIAVAQAIPVLQILFGLVLLFFALGAAALTGFGTHPEWMETHIGGTGTPVR